MASQCAVVWTLAMRSWVQCLVALFFLSSATILFYQERFYPGYSPEPGLKVILQSRLELQAGSKDLFPVGGSRLWAITGTNCCLPSPHTWGRNFVSLFEDTTGTNSPFSPEHKNTETKGKNRGRMKGLFSSSARKTTFEFLKFEIQIL